MKNFKVTHLIGGLAVQKQERLIGTEPDILIATPGRLWQMMESAEKGSYLKVSSLRLKKTKFQTRKIIEKQR